MASHDTSTVLHFPVLRFRHFQVLHYSASLLRFSGPSLYAPGNSATPLSRCLNTTHNSDRLIILNRFVTHSTCSY